MKPKTKKRQPPSVMELEKRLPVPLELDLLALFPSERNPVNWVESRIQRLENALKELANEKNLSDETKRDWENYVQGRKIEAEEILTFLKYYER